MLLKMIIVVVFCSIMLIQMPLAAQDMFQVVDTNSINLGYDEGARLLNSLHQSMHRKPKHRASEETILCRLGYLPRYNTERGFAHNHHQIAVFKGEITCGSLLGNFGDKILQGLAPSDFQIKKIEVVDDDRDVSFPIVQRGNDFIAVDLGRSEKPEPRYARVIIEHAGCVSKDRGCIATTSFIITYNTQERERLSFTRVNLNSRYYEEDCSVVRRIWNFVSFWPFN